MSITGTPSVMQTTSANAGVGRLVDGAGGAGGRHVDHRGVGAGGGTASATVLNTGTLSSNFWPPLPGVTPATTWVPYSSICLAWNEPSRPVMPCTTQPGVAVDEDAHAASLASATTFCTASSMS